MDVIVCPDASDYFFPGLAIIIRLPDVGGAIVHLVTFGGHIGGAGFITRCFDDADTRILQHIRWGNILPGFPIIPRDMHKPTVRTSPERMTILETGLQCEHARI